MRTPRESRLTVLQTWQLSWVSPEGRRLLLGLRKYGQYIEMMMKRMMTTAMHPRQGAPPLRMVLMVMMKAARPRFWGGQLLPMLNWSRAGGLGFS